MTILQVSKDDEYHVTLPHWTNLQLAKKPKVYMSDPPLDDDGCGLPAEQHEVKPTPDDHPHVAYATILGLSGP